MVIQIHRCQRTHVNLKRHLAWDIGYQLWVQSMETLQNNHRIFLQSECITAIFSQTCLKIIDWQRHGLAFQQIRQLLTEEGQIQGM